MATEQLARLRREKYVRLTTFKRDGTAVPTPVWFAIDGDRLVVYTGAGSGKVKRLRNNPEVSVAPCSARGQVTGPEVPGLARILPAAEGPRVQQLLNRKYGIIKRLFDTVRRLSSAVRRRGPVQEACLEITLR